MWSNPNFPPQCGLPERLAYQYIIGAVGHFIRQYHENMSMSPWPMTYREWFRRRRNFIVFTADQLGIDYSHSSSKEHFYKDATAILGITVLLNLLPNITQFGSHAISYLTDSTLAMPHSLPNARNEREKPFVTYPNTQLTNIAISKGMAFGLGSTQPHQNWCTDFPMVILLRKAGQQATQYTEFGLQLELRRTPHNPGSPGLTYVTHLHLGKACSYQKNVMNHHRDTGSLTSGA